MFNKPFLYENRENIQNNSKAIIVLPEIFGLTQGIKEITDKFAIEFGVVGFALDFFYELTGVPNSFDYETGGQQGFELMKQMSAEKFNNIFNQTLDYISHTYPEIKELIVVGFCFGGRLAYLTGINNQVTRVISFYGSRPNEPYFNGKSVVEALTETRKNDPNLKVLALFGGQDSSIPSEDIQKTEQAFRQNNVDFRDIVFPEAGHAFFNHHRSAYHQTSAQEAWKIIEKFLS